MCSETNEHSSCSENLEVVPNDELEKRRVLFEICKENYYDEKGRAARLDAKGSSYLIFYSILANAGVMLLGRQQPESLLILHLHIAFFILVILGLMFAFLSLKVRFSTTPDVSIKTVTLLENQTTSMILDDFARFYSEAISENENPNNKKVQCLELSGYVGIASIVTFAVLLLLIITI
ncbi:hypothetical protein [Mesotoga sp.]|uniref:hypothetical protein n=1 Tax=Mesotoga sp. TaxID=2053577 RepID=UPI00345E772D